MPTQPPTTRHGGDLLRALELYGGDYEQWLDLSTGISPWNYPIPAFDESTWRNLPRPDDALLKVASNYYGCRPSEIIATPGSQLSIRLIAQCVDPKQTVAIPSIGYQEHAASWALAGHTVIRYRGADELADLIERACITSAVIINPNNPTGERFTAQRLQDFANGLSGVLIVDEAFADLHRNADTSPCTKEFESNLIRFKSIGKFFGLAGARIGFTIGVHSAITKVEQLLSPWSIAAPSAELAILALSDVQWHQHQIDRINRHAKQQRTVIASAKRHLPDCEIADQGLFFSLFSSDDAITKLHQHLITHKIWSRLGDSYQAQNGSERNWLRLSLAGEDLNRLSKAFASITMNAPLTTANYE